MKRIAVITGASSGMGKQFVLQLEKYYDVDEIVVIARRKERLEELQKDVKVKITPLPLDLSLEESFIKYQEFLKENNPEIRILINCAGFGKFEKFFDGDLLVNDNMVDLNCKAMQALCFLSVHYMKKGDEILNIASMSSIQPVPYIALYSATKAFVLSLSRALNKELRHSGIKVSSVLPFWTKTEFFDIANKQDIVKYFEIMYSPEFIASSTYKYLSKKHHKDYYVPGKYARFQYRMVKILPHSLVMKIWLKKQKYDKRGIK